ncbi:MAG: DUF839 domain-containing protein [Cyanobium sp. MAG_237]|nr:DUF839 domain-containing protein [Cyanobium sp. MAG_237]
MNRSALKRRQLLELLGIGAGSSACAMLLPQLEARSSGKAAGNAALPFVPVRAPLPLPADGLSAADQRRIYRTFNVDDKLLVPEGYRAELLAVWGDPLATGRFGFNNDYLAFQPLSGGRALLSIKPGSRSSFSALRSRHSFKTATRSGTRPGRRGDRCRG